MKVWTGGVHGAASVTLGMWRAREVGQVYAVWPVTGNQRQNHLYESGQFVLEGKGGTFFLALVALVESSLRCSTV